MNIIALHPKEGKGLRALLSCVIAFAILFFWAFSNLLAAWTSQKSFSCPEEAVKSLVNSVRTNDLEEMMEILGPGSRELIYSGDEVADRIEREKFLNSYDQMNTLQQESADKMVLVIGSDKWPLPIPIVKRGTSRIL